MPWPDPSRKSPNSKAQARGRSTPWLRHRSLRPVSRHARAQQSYLGARISMAPRRVDHHRADHDKTQLTIHVGQPDKQDEPMDASAQSGTANHRRGVRPPQAREGGKGGRQNTPSRNLRATTLAILISHNQPISFRPFLPELILRVAREASRAARKVFA